MVHRPRSTDNERAQCVSYIQCGYTSPFIYLLLAEISQILLQKKLKRHIKYFVNLETSSLISIIDDTVSGNLIHNTQMTLSTYMQTFVALRDPCGEYFSV